MTRRATRTSALTDHQLMAMHVQALFTHDARSRLVCVNEPGGGSPAPRMFIGRTRAANLWRFRADLPEALVEALEALCRQEPVGEDFPASVGRDVAAATLSP